MIEVKKNERETTFALMRRFTKKVQRSGVLMRARAARFRNRPKSNLKKKKEAIKRARKQKQVEYLRKIGKIE